MYPLTPTGKRGTKPCLTRRPTEPHHSPVPPTLLTCSFLSGDALAVLRTLPADVFHAAITSPPYFNLRDYSHHEQIGREATVEAYLDRLVAVFREVRRVLRPDGSLWLNIGDSFANSGWKTTAPGSDLLPISGGVKRKDLLGIPWLLALALRADGWYLRCDVVWSKNNCTPESAADRPSRAHEYVFLLTKSARYYYDRDAVREPNIGKPPVGKKAANLANRARMSVRTGLPTTSVNCKDGKWADNPETHAGFVAYNPRGRNRRSVWKLPVSGFRSERLGITDVDHFAIMPPGLVRTCLLASTSAGGCCASCGTPLRRVVFDYEVPETDDGWNLGCACSDLSRVPCTVLDPFAGSGTVGVIAKKLGRSATLIDLNDDYLRLARARVAAGKEAVYAS